MKILEEFEKLKKREDSYGYPNNPNSNPYVTLAECFEFYPWLLELLENEKNIRKSIVLSSLYDKEFDKKIDELKEFVIHPFENCKTQDKINQKWHYIAYDLLKEYWGIIGRKDGRKDYVTLAECFEFYPWLLELLENEKNIRKSIVLSFLYDKEFDKKIDELKEFVIHPFENCKTQDKISQKWHYFISYYLLKEYWGIIGRNDGIKDFENKTAIRLPNLNEWLDK